MVYLKLCVWINSKCENFYENFCSWNRNLMKAPNMLCKLHLQPNNLCKVIVLKRYTFTMRLVVGQSTCSHSPLNH